MSEEENRNMPSTWTRVTIGELGQVVSGGTPSTKNDANFGGDIAWVTPADLSGYEQKYISAGRRNITREGLLSSSAVLMPENTVLFSSRAPVGYVAISSNAISTNQGFKSLIPHPNINSEYVYYYLKASKQLAEERASGTTFLELSSKAFANLPIPIPPLNEQKRIVEKLEQLLSELDKAVDALKAAQQKLKTYRRAVLKAAVEGELSRAWREENKAGLEPAEKLLERILLERRKKWEEAELEKIRAKGKEPKDDKWKGKYKEPELSTISNHRDLPEKWLCVPVGLICDCIVPNRDKPKSFSGDIPWITLPDINPKTLHVTASKSKIGLTRTEVKESRARVIPERSVIMSCVGRFGLAATTKNECVINQQLHAFLPPESLVPEYLTIVLLAQVEYMESIATSTTIAYLNKNNCNSVPVPLPSLDEQIQIVEATELLLSAITSSERNIDNYLKRANTLRQAILQKAFIGRLVRQDPDDEPASVLLERLRAEREAAGAKGQRGKKKTAEENQPRLLEVDA